jgi:hypothetical protein
VIALSRLLRRIMVIKLQLRKVEKRRPIVIVGIWDIWRRLVGKRPRNWRRK